MNPDIGVTDFQLLFESTPGLYLVLKPDPKFIILAVSNHYAAATMTKRENILGHGIFEVFPDNPDDPEATGTRNLSASLNRVVQFLKPDRMAIQKYDIRKPESQGGDFEVRYWSPVNSPVLNPAGKLIAIIHQVEDVTENVRLKARDDEQTQIAEGLRMNASELRAKVLSHSLQLDLARQTLHSHELRFQILVENIKDYGIFILDPKGHIVSWNPGAERIKQYKADEVIGRYFSMLYLPEDIAAHVPQRALDIASEKGNFQDEGWRVRKDGSKIWANVVITAIRDADGKLQGLSKITRDLTERRQMEEALRVSKGQLETKVQERTAELAKALRARDEFLSIASHELKTPLTSLKLQTQIRKIRANRGDYSAYAPELISKTLEDDERQINRLVALVNDMFDINRLTSGRTQLSLENLDICKLFHEVAERLSLQLQVAGVTLEVVAPDTLAGRWDGYRLEQVFTNLLTNAMKYGDRKPVQINIRQTAGETVNFEIRDQGIGIEKASLERIFMPYERAVKASDISGLGLGLYISKEIIEAHGGRIRVESAVGQGSAFLVELPLQAGGSIHG